MSQEPEFKDTHSDHGFEYAEFVDSYGSECLLGQSCAVGDYPDSVDRPGSSAIWLGVVLPSPELHSYKDQKQLNMHLPREHVEELVRRLKHWLKTGNVHV